MSVEITRKGRYQVRVEGANFSQHNEPFEGIQKASEILGASPAARVTLTPPVIEIVASGIEIELGSTVPVLSDMGEDVVEFFARLAGNPMEVVLEDWRGNVTHADSFWQGLELMAEKHKGDLLVTPMYGDYVGDGKSRFVGLTWKGYIFTWHRRKRGAISIGA